MTLRPLALALAALALAAASPGFAQAPDADLAPELQACVDAPETEAEAETGLMTCSRALEAAENDLDRAGIHVKIANLWLALGDTNAAISAVDKGAELAPEGEALLYQAAVRYRAGLYDEALAMAEAGLRDRPDDPDLTRLRLLALTDARRYEEARAGLERLYRRDPSDIEIASVLAGVYAALGETRRMDRILDAALKLAPGDTALRYLRGVARVRDQDWAGGAADLDIALADAPEDWGLAARAVARAYSGDREGALGDLSAIQDPRSLTTLSAIYAVRAAVAVEDYARALIFAEAAVDSASAADMATTLVHLGEVRVLAGLPREARANFEKAAVLEPQNARAWAGLGSVTLDSDPAQAAIFYERALAIAPTVAEFHAGLAEAATRDGDLATAETIYFDLIKAFPEDATLHAAMANVLVAQGHVKTARASTAEALRLAPGDPAHVLAHAEVLALLDEDDAALKLIDQLVAAGDDSASARYLAAILRRNRADYEAALREADAGLALAPDDPDLLEEKGAIYYMLDDPLSAREWLERALAVNPKAADALYLRGLVRAELGDAEGAAADQAAAVALDPSLAEEL
jgi:tetratricopeptide (TPR) repeat protein